MPKILGRLAFLAVIPALSAAPSWVKWDFLKKFEYSLLTGATFTRTEAFSAYRDTWSQELLNSVFEETVISPEKGGALAFRLAATYYLRPKLGLQAGLGFMSAAVPNTATFNLAYVWKSGLRGTLAGEWMGTGRLRSIPFFVNAVWRHRWRRLGLCASAGPAIFFNAVRASATAGLGVSDVTTVLTYTPPVWTPTIIQHLDAVPAALEIPKTRWMSLGFNAGIGGDYAIDARFAATIDLRFFYGPAKNIGWTLTPGTYPGMVEDGSRWTISPELARYAETRTTALPVDPSYFQIAAGVKIILR